MRVYVYHKFLRPLCVNVRVLSIHPQYVFSVSFFNVCSQYLSLICVLSIHPQYVFSVSFLNVCSQYPSSICVLSIHPQYVFSVSVLNVCFQYLSSMCNTFSLIMPAANIKTHSKLHSILSI